MTSDHLEERLLAGETMINVESDPNRRQALEDYWLRLLGDYEDTVDRERQQEGGAAV